MPSLPNKPAHTESGALGVIGLAQRRQSHKHGSAPRWEAAEMWASLFQTWGVGGGTWGRPPQPFCF